MRQQTAGLLRTSDFPLQTIILFGLLTSVFGLSSCKKDKFEGLADNRRITDSRAPSNVRIVNLAGYNQVVVRGDSLTNFIVRDPNSTDYYQYPGTSYFPDDGRMGKTWAIPQDLFDANEDITLHVASRNFQGLLNQDNDLTAHNDDQQPMDYFLLPTLMMDGQPGVVPLPRGVTAPAKAGYFKIRIINLTGPIKNQAFNSSGALEDLTGSVSLVYADGQPVDPGTKDISTAAVASEYVEVPYGTYQFKVLLEDGRQVPGLGGSEQYEYGIIDPPTSTIATGLTTSSNLAYAPIQTYQPGGIYTIVVTAQEFRYYINELNESAPTYQNAFQILSDNSPPANTAYSRIQGVNAFAGETVSFRVNGQKITEGLGFGEGGENKVFITGTYKVEAVNGAGNVMASAELALRPAQNYTAWLYPDAAGAAKLLLLPNDLSGSWYAGANDDATYSRYQYRFFFYKRFLNLSAGNPYITFTVNNGQPVSGIDGDNPLAGVNLQPGIPVTEQPYIRGYFNQPAYGIMAYRSKPEVVPGTFANDIGVLESSAFIASKQLYEKPGRDLPVQEPGIYTVVLIGESGNAVPEAQKARMIIVKHNK